MWMSRKVEIARAVKLARVQALVAETVRMAELVAERVLALAIVGHLD